MLHQSSMILGLEEFNRTAEKQGGAGIHAPAVFLPFLRKDWRLHILGIERILYKVSTDSAEEYADSRKLLVYTNLYSDILGKM